VFGTLIVIFMVGMRYKVGADWQSYELIYHTAGGRDLVAALGFGDPAYQLVNWFAFQEGLGIWAVNLACAAIFGWGLYRFCAAQSFPWLAAAVAVPYMVVVVAMGYTRQGVALGILLAGLARQIRGASAFNFALFTLVAAAFHGTAVVVFPIVAMSKNRTGIVNILFLLFSSYLLYDIFLGNSMDKYFTNYIRANYSSQGAFIRLAMNAVAGSLLFNARRRLQFPDDQWRLWRNFSVASFAALLVFPLIPSSTALDRISLYLIPLQLAVLSRVGAVARNKGASVGAILLYMAAVQGVWLVFAKHSEYWLPYRVYPVGDPGPS
jgi:hypothetical protein